MYTLHAQLSFNSVETGFCGLYFLSKCFCFLASVLMEKMVLFQSTKMLRLGL